jgi:hypothetical protein
MLRQDLVPRPGLDRTLEWTRSRPLVRPCGPAAFGSIPFAVSQTAQVPGANPLKDARASPYVAILAPWSSIGGEHYRTNML